MLVAVIGAILMERNDLARMSEYTDTLTEIVVAAKHYYSSI